MNRYGRGPGIINRRRGYRVEAACRMNAGFYARSAEEDRFPGIVLEITDVYEDD